MDKISSTSLSIEKENIEKLKELFPNAVTEGKINFDVLKADLGDEIDNNIEKYQFTWPGKKEAIKIAQTPSSATLRPVKAASKDWDTTENLYIEGDNLEVLKQLQKTYYGKVDVIYIDPPYNTGLDFVYKDSFSDSIKNYKEQTKQTTSSNPETNGRYHTNWLNMIYPRLLLAKNLLSKGGIIFISIDDNECFNLKKICDEIFGESNFICNFIRKTSFGEKTAKPKINKHHDYILCYTNDIETVKEKVILNGEEKTLDEYDNPDNDPNGPWKKDSYLIKIDNGRFGYARYGIHNPYLNITHYPPVYYDENNRKQWHYIEDTFKEMEKNGQVVYYKNKSDYTGEYSFFIKKYQKDINDKRNNISTLFFDNNDFTNANGSKDISITFDESEFNNSYPKPVNLIEKLIEFATWDKNDALVIDFFSGSGTTAESVLKNNYANNKRTKFILVQLPEKTEGKSKYETICQIGEERIRKVGENLINEHEKKYPKDGLFSNDEEFDVDIGFKVFKLDSSNIVEWDDSIKLEEKELSNRLREIFKKDRSKEDILYEIMLKYGVFDKKVEEISINNNTMYNIKYEKKNIVICLDDVDENDIKEIGKLQPTDVIFNEAGFKDDNAKINAVYNLNKAGVKEVKCI